MVDDDSKTNNSWAVANRIDRAFRLRAILVDELGASEKADIEHWGDDEWANLGRIDFDRRQAKNPTSSRYSPPSEATRRAVLALLGPVEGIVVEGELADGVEDPFEGLAS